MLSTPYNNNKKAEKDYDWNYFGNWKFALLSHTLVGKF